MSFTELIKYDGLATPDQIIAYPSKGDSLQYLASVARPDIAFTARKLAEFLAYLSPLHLAETHRALSYLNGTKYLAIEYSGHSIPVFRCCFGCKLCRRYVHP
ncbi:hypothetical protein V1525DRAFT_390508 [Lipomyces kononenkoae]|uniref:Uncharacterized protein n=1 Tax=Lipomyces kononenkoae TaxID=34357 RepID=A0ACC3SUP8_LIPKO